MIARRMLRRIVVVITALTVVMGSALAGSAGAEVGVSKKKFCKAVQKPTDADLETLSTDSEAADLAVKQVNRLLKAKPPKKVTKALKVIKKAHKTLAEGGDASEIDVDAFDTASEVVASYIVANCLF